MGNMPYKFSRHTMYNITTQNMDIYESPMYAHPKELPVLVYFVYHKIWPIIITIGIASNGMCLVLTTRKNLQRFHITRLEYLLITSNNINVCPYFIDIKTP